MAEELKPLKKGDAVYIKSWNVTGTVVHARPAETEDDGIYKVEVKPHFFRRSDLRLDTTLADREKRRQTIKDKTSRVEVASQKLTQAASQGGTPDFVLLMEYWLAMDELRKEYGESPLLIDLNAP